MEPIDEHTPLVVRVFEALLKPGVESEWGVLEQQTYAGVSVILRLVSRLGSYARCPPVGCGRHRLCRP